MKNIHATLEKALMTIMAVFFAAPLLLFLPTLFMRTGTPQGSSLVGVEIGQTSVPFSWPAFFHARYQESLAEQFNRGFPCRSMLIRCINEIYFRLFKTCSMKQGQESVITVGRNDTLYETAYLREYCLQRPDADQFLPLVRDIKRLQDVCERLGMGFVVVISPSKAAIFPEDIPARWLRHYDPRPRSYDLFLPLVRQQGIHCVDGHALTAEAKNRAPTPIFPKGGIHWGQYGAWVTANAVLAELHAQGKALQPMEYSGVRISNSPRGEDEDLLHLMNMIVPWHYPVAQLSIQPAEGRPVPRPNLVIIGDSFSQMTAILFSESKQFSEIEYYFYYTGSKRSFVDGDFQVVSSPVKPLDFDREIFAADCLVLELNEQGMPDPHHLRTFVSDALAHLPEANKPKPPFLYERSGGGK